MAAWGMLALGEPRGRVEGVAYAHMREHTRESPHCLVSLSPDLFWLLIIFEASCGLLCICMLWYEHSLCSCMHVEYLERPRASTRRGQNQTDRSSLPFYPCSAWACSSYPVLGLHSSLCLSASPRMQKIQCQCTYNGTREPCATCSTVPHTHRLSRASCYL